MGLSSFVLCFLILKLGSCVREIHRRLLQDNSTFPETQQSYCYPTGVCELSILQNNHVGMVLEGDATGDYSSWALGSAGDVNSDGISDLYVGATRVGGNAGKVYVVFGSKNWSTVSTKLGLLANGVQGFALQGAAGDAIGSAVANVPDMNGDGISDLVLGASQPTNGKSYVVFGSNTTNAWGSGTVNLGSILDGRRGFVLLGEAADDRLGCAVGAGDWNGDGLSDVVVGAYQGSPSPNKLLAGKSYVVFGSKNSAWGNGTLNISGWVATGQRGFILQGTAGGDWSGFSVCSLDMNADNISDLVISAPFASASPTRAQVGKTYVVFGSRNASTWSAGTFNLSDLADGQRGFVLQGELSGDNSGYMISSAGDVNGDGIDDLLIGAPNSDSLGNSNAGKSYVVFGSRNSSAWTGGVLELSDLMDGRRGFVLRGEAINDYSGRAVSNVGDFNNDGTSDLLIGAYVADPAPDRIDAGKSYVVFGSKKSDAWGAGVLDLKDLMDGHRGFLLRGDTTSDFSGASVGSPGDINADGVSDLLVGAYLADLPTRVDAGKSYLAFGNGMPLIFTRNALSLVQAETVRLTLENINVASTASGIDVNNSYFTVSNLSRGIFAAVSAPNVSISNFYLRNVSEGQILFIHDANFSAPVYRLFVSHAEVSLLSAIYSDPEVEFYADPNPPSLLNNRLIVEQGVSVALSSSDLSATDANDPLGNLSFVVSDISRGQFNMYSLGGDLIQANITQFFQQAVTDGRIKFVPDGSRSEPAYKVSVSDLLSTKPAQQANILFFYAPELNLSVIIVDQGKSTLLRFADISASDRETASGDILLQTSGAVGGYFSYMNASNGSHEVTSFNQSALLADRISFVTYSNASNVSFAFRAFDGSLYTPWQYPVIHINHAPLVQFNISDVSVNKNRLFEFVLQPNIFVDPDNDTLTYQASMGTSGGPLPREIHFFPPGTFEGQLLGTESILIQITAVDGRGMQAWTWFVLENFNAPPMLHLRPMIFDQDKPTTVRYVDLSATDLETLTEDIILEVDQVTGGHFVYASAIDANVTVFRQFVLIIGTLQFVQNGGNAPPSFIVRAFDGLRYSPWQTANVSLNYKPLREGTTTDQTVTQGDDFSFSLASLSFRDPDVSDRLKYTAQLKGIDAAGSPLPPELVFSPPRSFSGNLPTVGSFNIEIGAYDQRGLKASASFILFSQESKTAYYRSFYSSVSGVVGTCLAVFAYLWFRRRVAKHRRGFVFANALRKALNLEYYDFTRFDGEVYKTKIDNFLQRLQLEHQEFYTRLTLSERSSFAVCVAEILTAHGFVSPSDYGYGLFGLLCCLTVGWASQLDLKRFEEEGPEIAAEAISIWNECTQYQFRPMSDLAEHEENGTIYLEIQDSLVHYVVMDAHVQHGGERGTITADELEAKVVPLEYEQLVPFWHTILEIISKNGHTRDDKAARRWRYHSPTMKEKLRVFFCLQTSHTRTFVTHVQTQSIELQKLKKYEVTNFTVGSKSRDFESRVSSVEEQLQKTARTVQVLVEKFEASEAKPLLS